MKEREREREILVLRKWKFPPRWEPNSSLIAGCCAEIEKGESLIALADYYRFNGRRSLCLFLAILFCYMTRAN